VTPADRVAGLVATHDARQLVLVKDAPQRLTAEQVKAALYARQPTQRSPMPGAWTVIEEWRAIDLLAFSAWESIGKYARVGYEVKVSRSDMRSELLAPGKRARNVAWCNEFYIAIPAGLLTEEELAFEEPEWAPEDWIGEPCPGYLGKACRAGWRRKTHFVEVPIPSTGWAKHDYVKCPTCNGLGVTTVSRVEREAPTLWIPADVGLVVVDGRGTRVVKKSPRRKEVPALSRREVGQLVRWASMRPDPRHHPHRHADALAVSADPKAAK